MESCGAVDVELCGNLDVEPCGVLDVELCGPLSWNCEEPSTIDLWNSFFFKFLFSQTKFG